MSKQLQQNESSTFFIKFAFLIIFLIQILQAYFTELWDDEAYYAVYAKHLDWGYFDHPPMVALCIYTGNILTTLFGTIGNGGELNIRFVSILMFMGSLYLILKIIEPKYKNLFWAVIFSIVPLFVMGFMAVPDIPLIFFATCLLFIYKQYLQKNTWSLAILIGLWCTAMLYSKYHGILVIGFIILSNLRLLRDPKIYVAALITAAALIPHILWQIQYNAPSLKYHFIERNSKSFSMAYPGDYMGGQVLIWGPLFGWLVIGSAGLLKAENLMDRAMKFVFTGILLFFLVSTYKGWVEANWTVAAYPAAVYTTYFYLEKRPVLIKWLYRLLPISIILQLVMRCLLVFEILPTDKMIKQTEYFGNPQWVAAIKSITGEEPVVFADHYHLVAQFDIYSGGKNLVSAYPVGRKSQYNIWAFDEKWQTDSLWFVAPFKFNYPDTLLTTTKGRMYFKKMSKKSMNDTLYMQQFLDIPKKKTL